MAKLTNKQTINEILDQMYNGEIPERFQETMKNKNKPEDLSYEEELLLKYSLPVAYLLYLLRALGYVLLAIVAISIVVCIGIFWYGYIPHLINTFLFEKFPHLYAVSVDADFYFDNGILVLVIFWAVKDMLLYLLYLELTSNLDRVKKIKEESKELFDD